MANYINYQNTKLSYTDKGLGKTIVLLHGYLESNETWGNFADDLSKNFRVIAIDLLGHGQSGCLSEVHTMEAMAEGVKYVLDFLKIDKCVLVGHSMGGYVTMAFVAKFPEKLNGFCLFHSSPFADSEEKKDNRNREIILLKEGKKELIYNTHCPKVFADINILRFQNEIEKAKQIAKNTSTEGIIAVLEGMKVRKDHTSTLQNTVLSFLYIIGERDNFIPMSILSKIQMPEKSEILILENSGHNGFIEEKDKCLETISAFVSKCDIKLS